MKYLLSVAFAFVVGVCACPTHAQQPTFRQYTTHDGLPAMQTTWLETDSKQMLWVATKSGHATFDGVQFVPIPPENIHVTKLLKGKDNLMFAAYANSSKLGVMKQYLPQPDYIINKKILENYNHTTNLRLQGDTLWFALQKDNDKQTTHTIAYLYKRRITLLPQSTFVIKEGIDIQFYFFIDDATNQPIVCYNQKLFWWDTKTKQPKYLDLPARYLPARPYISVVKHTAHQNYYIATDHYILQYNARTRQTHAIDSGKIHAAAYTQHNTLIYYKTTANPQQYRFVERNAVGQMTSTQILFFDKPWHTLIDNEHNYWTATESGLYKMRLSGFLTFDKPSGMLPKIVQVIPNKKGQVYFAPFDTKQGICYYTNDTTPIAQVQISKNYPKVADQETYYGGVCLPDNTLLIPNAFGYMTYNEKTGFQQKKLDGSCIFYAYLSPKTNDLLLGGYGGAGIFYKPYNTEKWQQFPINNNKNILGITQDANQTYWFIGRGFGVFDTKNIYFMDKDRMPENQRIRGCATTTDHKGNVWLASTEGQGLAMYDAHKYPVNIKDTAKLYSRLVFVNDHRHLKTPIHALTPYYTATDTLLLIGTNKGLAIMNLALYYSKKVIEIQFFDKKNGFDAIEIDQNGIVVDGKNQIWITANTGGLTMLNYNKSKPNNFVPTLFFTKIAYLNDASEPQTILENKRYHQNIDTTLTVAHTQRNMVFEFVGISHTSPQNVLYSYKMQGVSNQWSVWTTTPKITLTNLPAGDYSLQIKAKNEQSNETTPQTIRLHIEQIFYKTWWFYVFCVMGLMMLLLVWRHNEIQKSNKKQAQALYLAQLKTKVLEAQVKGIESQFTTHFVLNVLSVLLAKIGMNKQAEAEKFIHQISNFYKSVLTNNKTVYRTVAQEIQNAQKYLDLTCGMHRDKPIKCDFLNENNTHNPDINNLLVPAGFMQIYIENAFKHGLQFKNDGEREIHIEIITHADDHLFIIENNGKNLQDHTNKPDSTGKGIAFIQEIAAMYNPKNPRPITQTIAPSTRYTTGVKMTLTLPKNYVFE